MIARLLLVGLAALLVFEAVSCANTTGSKGFGASCESDGDCENDDQQCLSFPGGYCGTSDCESRDDCPSGAACVRTGDKTYCFVRCTSETDCNQSRTPRFPAHCRSDIEVVDPEERGSRTVCVPPSFAADAEQ